MIRVSHSGQNTGSVFLVDEQNGKKVVVKNKELIENIRISLREDIKLLLHFKSVRLIWNYLFKKIHDQITDLIDSVGTQLEGWKLHPDFKINEIREELVLVQQQLSRINLNQQDGINATVHTNTMDSIDSQLNVIRTRQNAALTDIVRDPNAVHAFDRKNRFLNREIVNMQHEEALLSSLDDDYQVAKALFEQGVSLYEEHYSWLDSADDSIVKEISQDDCTRLDSLSTLLFKEQHEHLKKCLLAITKFSQKLNERQELEKNRWDIFSTINRIEYEKARQDELKKNLKEAEENFERKLALFATFNTADLVERHDRQLAVVERNFSSVQLAHNGISVHAQTSSSRVITDVSVSGTTVSTSSGTINYVQDVTVHVPSLALDSLGMQQHFESEETKRAKEALNIAKATVEYWTREIDLLRQFEEKLIELEEVPNKITSRNNVNLAATEQQAAEDSKKWQACLDKNKGESLDHIIYDRRWAVANLMEGIEIEHRTRCFKPTKEESHLSISVGERELKQKLLKAILNDYNIELGFFSKACGNAENQTLVANDLQRKQLVRILSSVRFWGALNPDAVLHQPESSGPILRDDSKLKGHLEKKVSSLTTFMFQDYCERHGVESNVTVDKKTISSQNKLWPPGF